VARRRDGPIVRILLIWGINVVALWVADLLVDDVSINPWWRAITTGAIFGIVNWAVKPIIKLLALPLIIITVGIALFFVNLLVVYITSWLSSGFNVDSFGGAIGATIVLWFVNAVLVAVFGIGDSRTAKAKARA
jgi:putative membrane protein